MAENWADVLSKIAGFGRRQINSAGARYTPAVDATAPNIHNEELFRALNHLTCGSEVEREFIDAIEHIRERWKRSRSAVDDAAPIEVLIEEAAQAATSVAADVRAGSQAGFVAFIAAVKGIETQLSRQEDDLAQRERSAIAKNSEDNASSSALTSQSDEAGRLRGLIRDLRHTSSFLSELLTAYEGTFGALLESRLALLSGQWGTGKTHLLCDLTAGRLAAGRPVVLVLAKNFQQRTGLVQGIAADLEIAPTFEETIATLDAFGRALGERVLLLIDGVNEGPREAWRVALDEIAAAVAERHHVGLLVSCRSPFEDMAIRAELRARMTRLQHTGFSEREFDAQAEFFRYYQVPLPEVPLLNAEFSRPLTLKLICEAFRALRTKKAKEGFSGIASGQKGMTFVLESFVKRTGAPIEKEFGLPPKACWYLLKGSPRVSPPIDAGFAPHMAATLREYVGRRAALRIIARQHRALSSKRRAQLLDALRTNGLIDEDAIWVGRGESARRQIVFRLPYQRFSDHLIARHLLDTYLDTQSRDTVRASFASGQPLSRIFRTHQYHREYVKPGWAEALIVEFPEHVKRVIPEKERELIFFLGKRAQRLSYHFKPFVDGLFWRSPAAITDSTGHVVGALLRTKHHGAWCEVVDALIAISIKPVHPYSATRFYNYLAQFSMADRDLHWGEYLRKRYRSQSIARLMRWIEKIDASHLPEVIVPELVVLLSLVLVTVARHDRDVVTKALVVIGERYPRALFDHTIKTLEFNDPYVSERMLAACYGVVMSQWAISNQPIMRVNLMRTAFRLYRSMFSPEAAHASHHALARDYASNFILFVLRTAPNLLTQEQKEHLRKPFSQIPSPFPAPSGISDEQCADGKSAIHMDFGNYTMGRLTKNRANYDDTHPEYQDIRRQIEWRIGKLGYRKDLFHDIDREIGSDKSYAEQRGAAGVDRYGKKYSWIAYFEMYGLLEANDALDEWRLEHRTSDSDVDPSFPKAPPSWTPLLPDAFGDRTLTEEDWLRAGPTPDFSELLYVEKINDEEGPWLLLEGSVSREAPELNREVYTLLRGLLVKREDIPELEARYLSVDYPGNHEIPGGGEDHYLYAGEAVLAPRHCPELRSPDGEYGRQLSEAFRRTEPEEIGNGEEAAQTQAARAAEIAEELTQVDPSDEGKGFILSLSLDLSAMPKYREIPGIEVELPTRGYAWESYHSSVNDFAGFDLLAPRLIQDLRLHLECREIEYRDERGRRATLYRQGGGEWRGDRHRLLYIRQDLLEEYLKRWDVTLVWCNWGERDWIKKGPSEYGSDPRRDRIFQEHLMVHRRFVRYDDLRRST